ncbi:MAG: response regulator, partial [Myxococcales bacterium]|nr:response regulator [Myxococcales bacterium]
LREITETAGVHLGVARTSVWLYNEERSSIRCLELFDARDGTHSAGLELRQPDYPRYFEALATERTIAAHDAHRDPRTREFSAAYLTPLGIGALLDAPIRGDGRMLGVVCHEHVGPARRWSPEALSFAGSIGDLVSLAIASHERRRAEHERRRLEAKVEHAQKLESLGVLAGGIAHDFNNLLVGILGNARLARDELPPTSPVQELLGGVELAAQRAADLCNQLLAYSGKGTFVVEPVDLDAVVEQMRELLEMAVSKSATLRQHRGAQRPVVLADATQLRQVVMNMIMNASDALGGRQGVVELRTGVVDCDRAALDRARLGDGLAEGRYAFVEVSDTGCGMDPATVAKIFDPFYTTKFAGRGLGLAAVLGIVRSHHGAIDIASEAGRGTTFRVLLPYADAAVRAPQPTPAPGEWAGTGTVLLVDDDDVVRTVGQRMIERCGLQVLTARNGVDGLQVFEAHQAQIACVVLDLTMPVMGGGPMLRQLHRIDPGLPVVLCSGYSEQEA